MDSAVSIRSNWIWATALRRAVASAAIGLLPASAALAAAPEGNPQFTVVVANQNQTLSNLPAGFTQNSVSVFLIGTGGSGIVTDTYLISNGDTSEFIAGLIETTLNNDPKLNTDFTWGVAPNPVDVSVGLGNKAKIYDGYVVTGVATDPVVARSFGSGRFTGKGSLFPLRVYAAVDPFAGYADFEITGTPLGGGEVSLGVDGVEVTTMTTPGESDDTIMQVLDTELTADGITAGDLDLSTDELTELSVDTGDPIGSNGADPGVFMDTNDPGLTTFAAVFVPEPDTLSLLAAGPLAMLIGWRRRKA